MNAKRSIVVACAVLAWTAALPAADPPGANPAWQKLKTLVGDWKGTYAGSDTESPGEVLLSYKLVSNGSSLMETMESAHDTNMITVYHPDGSRIMATHYCAAGNQPRMVASALSPNGRTLAFAFVDATNVTDPDGELMRSLVVTFQDPDHFSQAWTSRAKGKDQIGTFEYTRVK